MRVLGRSEAEIESMDWRVKADMAHIHAYAVIGEQQTFAKLVASELAKILLPLLATR